MSSYSEYIERPQVVDREYALNMFADKHEEAIERFVQFMRESNSDVCLEVPENKVIVSDDNLREIVKQLFGIEAIRVCNEVRERQDQILQVMKGIEGVNIRQIARITGLSPTRVWKPETRSLSPRFALSISYELKRSSASM